MSWEVTSRAISVAPGQKNHTGNILSVFQIPLDPDDRSFIASFAAPYSPHFYFPQALGLVVGRELGLGPLALLYLGRLCTLVFCIWMFYWSIRKTPVLKWVFCLIAATPINMSLAASCSQDAVINGLAFLFTASVLDLALSPEKRFTARSVLFPAIVGALLAPAKGGAYVPMLAFFLFIPIRRAGSLPRYLGLVALAAIPALVTLAAWTLASQHQLLPLFDSGSTNFEGPNRITLLWGIWQDPLHYLWLRGQNDHRAVQGLRSPIYWSLGMAGYHLAPLDYHCVPGSSFHSAVCGRRTGKGVSIPQQDHRRFGGHLCLCWHSDHADHHILSPALARHPRFSGEILNPFGSRFFSPVP